MTKTGAQTDSQETHTVVFQVMLLLKCNGSQYVSELTSLLAHLQRSENIWCNQAPRGVSVTDMRSTLQSLGGGAGGVDGKTQMFPVFLLHLQSLVGYEDLKSLPIKTSLETMFSPQSVVKNKYRGDLSGSAAFL